MQKAGADGNFPSFIVIGAQRCATSWLYFCLKEHPDVYMPHVKELDYFSHYYDRGPAWYAEQFSGRKAQKAVGEVSPNYLFREEAAPRIRHDLPQARLIVSLRNPIERAFSQYKMQKRKKRLKADSFEEALSLKDHRYVERGFYYSQLMRYFQLFPKEQVLILIYEDLAKNPVETIQKVFSFIGVDPAFVPSKAGQAVQSEDIETGLYHGAAKAADWLKKSKLGFLVEAAKKTGFKDAARTLDQFGPKARRQQAAPQAAEKISIQTRQRLAERFSEENGKLSEFLGRDLSFWK